MPAKFLKIDQKARKGLRKIPLKVHQRIEIAFREIKKNPLIGPSLKGQLSYYRKLKVGDYRIVYRFNAKAKTVLIVVVEHRQGVYK